MPRKYVSSALEKWDPAQAVCGLHLHVLPIPRECYENQFPNDCEELNLNKITYLFYGKYMQIEVIKNHRNLRRHVRSGKSHESAARTINYNAPIRLYFEHT